MADQADKTIAALADDLKEETKGKRRAAAKAGERPDGEGNLDEALAGLGEAVTGQDQELYGAAGDLEGQHNTAIDRLHAMADDVQIDSESMVFDTRDFILDIIKSRPKPWSATSQGEQRDIAAAVEHCSRELVRNIVEAVASNGVSAIRVLLTKVAMGSEIVITGKVKTMDAAEEDAAVANLHRSINKHVMLTRATVEDYNGGGREAQTDPDEPDFGFEAGGAEED